MAASLPLLPSELIGKIVVFLPLNDVLNCKLVCKQWNVSGNFEFFSSGYLFILSSLYIFV